MRLEGLFGPIKLAQFPLHTIHNGRGYFTEIGIAVAIIIHESGM
jgi:hypothetical protein